MTDQVLTYSPAEAAARTGFRESWIRAQCRTQKVPHLRVGKNAIRLSDAHLKALVEFAEVQAAGKPAAPEPLSVVAIGAVVGATARSQAAHRRAASRAART